MKDLDIVIPYKKTYTDELKYCLRSLKNIPHRNVYIVGNKPEWVNNVIHIPFSHDFTRYIDVEMIVRKICHTDEISDDFILMNDDFFIMKKIESLPDWYSDTIENEYNRRINIKTNSRYVDGYRLTDNYLKSLGIKEPLDYALHIPIVMNKTKRLIVSELRMSYLKSNKILLSRSLYCNLFCEKGTQHPDVKYIKNDNNYKKYDFLSTLDSSFNNGEIGNYIKNKFKEKSQYEK